MLLSIDDATLIWENNKAAIITAENATSSAGRCKHIDVRFGFVAEAVEYEEARIRYCPTSFNHDTCWLGVDLLIRDQD